MKRLLISILIVTCALGTLSAARKALLIGNANYGSSAKNLKNPVSDTQLLERVLKDKGFSVSSHLNTGQKAFRDAVRKFGEGLKSEDEVVFYFSGHGAQINGVNYLIPIDADIVNDYDCETEAVSANWVLNSLSQAVTGIFILDACRNNPYLKSKGEGSRGLAAMKTVTPSQIIIFATEEGKEALDGSGANSPFVEALATQISSSHQKFTDMLPLIKQEVLQKTNHRQSPTAYGIPTQPFYFSLAPEVKEDKPVTPAPPKPQIETVWLYGNLEVETNLTGDLYLNGDKIQSLAAGQKAKISKLVTGDYTVELRTAEGNQSKQVSVQKDQTQSLAFKFEKKVQPAVTIPTPAPATPSVQPSTSTPANMVYVEGGTFNMGSNDGHDNEKPVHKVSVSSFYIGKYEVTQKEWREVMGSSPSYFKGDDKPVEQVSWYDVIEYCNQRSLKEELTPCYTIDKSRKDPNNTNSSDNLKWSVSVNWQANGYRLPTEAEWEYAARGGNKSRGYEYSGSNDIGSVAWYYENSYDKGENHPDYGTHKAGTKAANELGIYDMSGNVWEWCWDWYDSGYYGKSQSSDPIGAGSGSYRVVRGGSWDSNPVYLRVCNRLYYDPFNRGSIIGVRLVRAK